MIQISRIYKKFGSQQVLCGVDLEIQTGKTTAIVGPSGTGKSVLLKIITGLVPADSGVVRLNGSEISPLTRSRDIRKICSKIGVLFQAAALFDSMNIYDNVAFPLRYGPKLRESEIKDRVFKRLTEVGLIDNRAAMPGELSIGMRKRVGIARALVTDPEILLFDEPNTGLDPQVGQEIYELINETQKASGFTGIVISHEIPEVFQVCDRVAMLYQGVVQEEGSVEEFLASMNPIVLQFVSGSVDGKIQMNF